jgi:predicted nuclease with RNAse H fold
MTTSGRLWIGADPGGEKRFGVAILHGDGLCCTHTASYVDEAIEFIRSKVSDTPAGVGVDAPLWWSSGKSGVRKADVWIRERYHLSSGQVQAVNSLRGAVVAQGMLFVSRMREIFPGTPITETHPKAVLPPRDRLWWRDQFQSVSTSVTLDAKPDDERDALISAIAAREGFEGRWTRDLSLDRYPSEQDPTAHWIGPVHYFWPG